VDRWEKKQKNRERYFLDFREYVWVYGSVSWGEICIGLSCTAFHFRSAVRNARPGRSLSNNRRDGGHSWPTRCGLLRRGGLQCLLTCTVRVCFFYFLSFFFLAGGWRLRLLIVSKT